MRKDREQKEFASLQKDNIKASIRASKSTEKMSSYAKYNLYATILYVIATIGLVIVTGMNLNESRTTNKKQRIEKELTEFYDPIYRDIKFS